MQLLTAPTLERALGDVCRELESHGFMDEPLAGVVTRLVPFGSAYGWQWYGGSGEIHIPRVSLSRLSQLWNGQRVTLREVLRHEYAHALADTHRGLMRARHFAEAFGAGHHWNFEWEYDPEHHVSEYAAMAPAEDFAEVFALYLRHGGRIPNPLATPAIRRKWRFVDRLAGAVRRGLRRW